VLKPLAFIKYATVLRPLHELHSRTGHSPGCELQWDMATTLSCNYCNTLQKTRNTGYPGGMQEVSQVWKVDDV